MLSIATYTLFLFATFGIPAIAIHQNYTWNQQHAARTNWDTIDITDIHAILTPTRTHTHTQELPNAA